MTRTRFWLPLFTILALCLPLASHANDYKPDDRVIFDVSSEDWVTTKTARVTANVSASVSGATSGNTRVAMMKALGDLVKTDWRLISFNRGEDQTGMELWSAMFEARLPENMLSGLNENAKKLSKPGMQITIGGIDFSPTLEETQTALGLLRAKIYKMANDQLAALNAALPGRAYRIALINFTPDVVDGGGEMDAALMGGPGRAKMRTMMLNQEASSAPQPAMERSEKVVMTARVVLAVTPPEAK